MTDLFALFRALPPDEQAAFAARCSRHVRQLTQSPDEWMQLARAWKDVYDAHTHGDWQGFHANQRHLADAAYQLACDARARSLDFRKQCEKAARGFLADAWAAEKGYPLSQLAKNPLRYLESARAKREGPGPMELHERKIDDARQRGDYDEVDRLRALGSTGPARGVQKG